MNLIEQLKDVKDYFSPKIVTEVNDQYVKIGADIARGPEDYAFYISIGSAW